MLRRMIVNEKRAVLIDFGLMKNLRDTEQLTGIGRAVGTPLYMSPEQIRNSQLGPWSDIYSFAVVLYELLSGRNPFTGSTRDEVLRRQFSVQPENLFHVEMSTPVSRAFALVLGRAMNKDFRLRHQEAMDLFCDIERSAFYDDGATVVNSHAIISRARSYKRYWIIGGIIFAGVVVGILFGKFLL